MKNENNVMQKSQIAPCGMNCGICLAYLRDKNKCKGCWAPNDNKPKGRANCVIRNCEILNTLDSKFCYDCQKFPCARLKQLDKRYRTKYKMSMLDNLENIKANGFDKFIKEEHDRWLCNSCGGTICVHRGFCLNCKQ
jgi:hypothetical protein